MSIKIGLPRAVVILSMVSFLNDLASEMVIPLLPILLASVMHAGPVALGVIEGVADAIASFLRLWSGRYSDRSARRKPLTLLGYALSNTTRPLFGLAGTWTGVLVLRSVDRVGKGLRSAPRDALIADTTAPAIRGYAFGFHRALDNAGAVLGGLCATAILAWSASSIKEVMLWSAIPGALALILLVIGVSEKPAPRAPQMQPPLLRWQNLSLPLRRYLYVLGTFTFARASETFIILRGYELGISPVLLLLLWVSLNLAKAMTSTWGGKLSDAIGQKRVMLISWYGYSLAFFAFTQIASVGELWFVTLFFGFIAGFGEGAERALVSLYAQDHERGGSFGWYYLTTGLAAIPAGLLFGGVWAWLGASGAYAFAGLLALFSALLFRFWVGENK